MGINRCINFSDFRRLAQQRLPRPIFDYIDGGADDEVTKARNTSAFDDCDLLPSVLTGVDQVDLSVTVMGQRLDVPYYCSPTALQRLFHHQGERAVALAAAEFNTLFGVSSLGTESLEDIRQLVQTPQVYQFYFHKDRGLNRAMLERAKAAGIKVMMLTVDSVTGGNRERDIRSGFSIPMRLTPSAIIEFIRKPRWGIGYLRSGGFALPQLNAHIDFNGSATSIGSYFTEMLEPSIDWDDVAEMIEFWDGEFCLKGLMHPDDAKRAVDVGCSGVVVSNHGGRQLDGSRSSFDQLDEIVQAVGDDLDVLFDGGVQRGTHIIKALSLGAKAVGIGRGYLFPLAAGGQQGVHRALQIFKDEMRRDMQLLGKASIADLSKTNLRYR